MVLKVRLAASSQFAGYVQVTASHFTGYVQAIASHFTGYVQATHFSPDMKDRHFVSVSQKQYQNFMTRSKL